MNSKSLAILALATIACCGSGVTFAHHSFAPFAMERTVAVTGTVKQFKWVNPHSWLYVTVVRENGDQEEWGFELSSPNMMERWGWKYRDMKVGDKITVDAHPARNGNHNGAVYAIYLPNGKVLVDPMGSIYGGDELATGPKSAPPTKPTGEPYK